MTIVFTGQFCARLVPQSFHLEVMIVDANSRSCSSNKEVRLRKPPHHLQQLLSQWLSLSSKTPVELYKRKALENKNVYTLNLGFKPASHCGYLVTMSKAFPPKHSLVYYLEQHYVFVYFLHFISVCAVHRFYRIQLELRGSCLYSIFQHLAGTSWQLS